MKSQRARNLLLDDFFKSEMAGLEQAQMDIIVNSAPHELEEREEALSYATSRSSNYVAL